MQQQDELPLYHMLLHVAIVLRLLFARYSVLSLGCARTYGPVSRRRGRLGGRTLTLKQIVARLELDPPRSLLSDEAASEPETEEQQQGRYDAEFVEFLQR